MRRKKRKIHGIMRQNGYRQKQSRLGRRMSKDKERDAVKTREGMMRVGRIPKDQGHTESRRDATKDQMPTKARAG